MGGIIAEAGVVRSRCLACACLSFDRNIDSVLFPFLMTEIKIHTWLRKDRSHQNNNKICVLCRLGSHLFYMRSCIFRSPVRCYLVTCQVTPLNVIYVAGHA
jgi:hypothetical protein